LPPEFLNTDQYRSCPKCRAPLKLRVFPALVNPPPPISPGRDLLEGGSSCFYHPAKAAEAICEGCGRFLCALCDIDFNGKHLCSSCLEIGKKKGRMPNLQNFRFRYDKIALNLSILPIILTVFTLITAPIAFFMCFYYWKSPPSLTTNSKSRFIWAGIISGIQILIWIMIFGRMLA